ncbi:hypothetical protein JXA80_05150 [bacterium]|nr:hypothetical protein [candidate division CSSED10-310 bacterium]
MLQRFNICLIVVGWVVVSSVCSQTTAPTQNEILAVTRLFESLDFAPTPIVPDVPVWIDGPPVSGPSWMTQMQQMLSIHGPSAAEGNQLPFIMMAGYMDTEITWENGGVFKMLAWVWDADNDVASVEVYYDGQPTGVYLLDDGFSGDFGPGDDIYGLTFDIAPYSVPPGQYMLELRAEDQLGNMSDLWPYLTIHP